MSYAYFGECSSICDAICNRTGVAPGVVLRVMVRGDPGGDQGKHLLLVIKLFLRHRGGGQI